MMKKDKYTGKNQKNESRDTVKVDISSDPVYGEPSDVFDLINKYGTYNIQPTADTHHDYPQIAQGFSRKADVQSRKKDFGEK